MPEGSPPFETDYGKALETAARQGKPLVVVFSASWCPPCQSNRKNVYPSGAVKPFHDQFIWVYQDMDLETSSAAAKAFGVNGIPHIQFLSSSGRTLGQCLGGTTPDAFAGQLEAMLAAAKQ